MFILDSRISLITVRWGSIIILIVANVASMSDVGFWCTGLAFRVGRLWCMKLFGAGALRCGVPLDAKGVGALMLLFFCVWGFLCKGALVQGPFKYFLFQA